MIKDHATECPRCHTPLKSYIIGPDGISRYFCQVCDWSDDIMAEMIKRANDRAAKRYYARAKPESYALDSGLPDDLQAIRERLARKTVVITAWRWAKRMWWIFSRID